MSNEHTKVQAFAGFSCSAPTVKAEAAYWDTFDTALTWDLLCVSGFKVLSRRRHCSETRGRSPFGSVLLDICEQSDGTLLSGTQPPSRDRREEAVSARFHPFPGAVRFAVRT